MYPNLNAEMARNNIMQLDISKELNLGAPNLSEKMNGKKDFKLKECKKIKKAFFPNLSIDYLFEAKEDNSIQEKEGE